MADEPITPATNLFEALDRAPDARLLLRRRGLNPELECGVLTRALSLEEAAGGRPCVLRAADRRVRAAPHKASSRGRTEPAGVPDHPESEAEAAARRRDELLATVTCDLQIPLAVIQDRAQLLRQLILNGEVANPDRLLETLASIEDAMPRTARLIQELVDAAQLQAGSGSARPALERAATLDRSEPDTATELAC